MKLRNKINVVLIYVILIMSLGATKIYADHSYRTSIIKKIMPSVVEVISEKDMSLSGNSFKENIRPDKDGFKFRQRPNPNQPPQNDRRTPHEEKTHVGSGFVVSEDGHIITNAHVINNCIENCKEITIVFYNDVTYKAKIIGYDEDSDIAILKIIGSNKVFSFLQWGDKPELGEDVMAIGSPMNQSFTVTLGIVSSLDRFIPRAASFVPFIQTDASINPGNSGGPLFNTKGELIGITSMIITDSSNRGSIGLGFAIDGTYAQSVINKLYNGEQIVRPFLGIVYRPLESDDLKNFQHGWGAYIQEIIQDSPAFGILKEGDIILKIDGEKVKWKMLASIIKMKSIGDVVKLEIIRDGLTIPIEMTLQAK